MIRFQLHEVSPRLPAGDLNIKINDETIAVKYYNRDPYIPIQLFAGYYVEPESYPSYLVKTENEWLYGTYGEIKKELNG
jgi:hypothetical protein